jgi:threonine aldolase
MADRRKRGGALLSKHRFVAAQIEAFLAGGLWLKLARHANDMADRLAAGLTAANCVPVWPVEANEVFAPIPQEQAKCLKAAGATFYEWPPLGLSLPEDRTLIRLVTSFQTMPADVDRFLATLCG